MIRLYVVEGDKARHDPIHELSDAEFIALRLVAREFGADLPHSRIDEVVRVSGPDCRDAIAALSPIDADALDYHIDRRIPGEAADDLRLRWRRFETALKAGARGDGLDIDSTPQRRERR